MSKNGSGKFGRGKDGRVQMQAENMVAVNLARVKKLQDCIVKRWKSRNENSSSSTF